MTGGGEQVWCEGGVADEKVERMGVGARGGGTVGYEEGMWEWQQRRVKCGEVW